jgi:hypothetical protein
MIMSVEDLKLSQQSEQILSIRRKAYWLNLQKI